MKNNKVCVSIIVPIYNSEEYLNRCLDSLVFQTLNEIEIIAVDNGSTDKSRDIIDSYSKTYPNKIYAYTIEHQNYAGAGRNFGIKKAKGEYIAFCDSDDMLPLTAIENLYNKALSAGYDLVYSPFYYCENGNTSIVHTMSSNIDNETLLVKGNVSLWNKLYRRDLVEQAGFMPEDFSFEDLAYYQILVSHAKKIGYLDEPSYYYIIRNNSEVNAYASLRMLDMLKACTYSQEYGELRYKKAITVGNIKRVISHINKRWPFYNAFVEYIANTVKSIGMKTILNYDSNLYNEVKALIANYSGEKIPRTIILGNSKGDISKEKIQEIKNKAFYQGCEVVVINDTFYNQNNRQIDEMLRAGEYDFVDSFLALNFIYENGGVFLSNDMKIDNPLDYLLQYPCFFSFEYEGKITDKVFGGAKGNKIFGNILNTYEIEGKYDAQYTLSQRMSNVLFLGEGVPRTNIRVQRDNLIVFPNHMFVYNYSIINNMFVPNIHFTHFLNLFELGTLYEYENKVVSSIINYGKGTENSTIDINRRKIEEEKAKNKLNEILNSNTYRVGLKIKKIFNKPFLKPFLRLYLHRINAKKTQ